MNNQNIVRLYHSRYGLITECLKKNTGVEVIRLERVNGGQVIAVACDAPQDDVSLAPLFAARKERQLANVEKLNAQLAELYIVLDQMQADLAAMPLSTYAEIAAQRQYSDIIHNLHQRQILPLIRRGATAPRLAAGAVK